MAQSTKQVSATHFIFAHDAIKIGPSRSLVNYVKKVIICGSELPDNMTNERKTRHGRSSIYIVLVVDSRLCCKSYLKKKCGRVPKGLCSRL